MILRTRTADSSRSGKGVRVLTVTALAGALALTAGCGGSQNKASLTANTTGTSTSAASTAPTTGAGSSSTSGASSPSSAPAATVPAAVLPPDFTIVTDDAPPSDPAQKAIWDGWLAEQRAFFQAASRQDPNDRLYQLWTGPEKQSNVDGTAIVRKSLGYYHDHGLTITGTDRFYHWKIAGSDNLGTHLTWCEDQSKTYDKDPKTGKVVVTAPSRTDFRYYRSTVQQGPDGRWITVWINGLEGDPNCT
jgi:hypothetical protein